MNKTPFLLALFLATGPLAGAVPLKPMDDTSFIAQMAQFSSLQQMSLMQANQQQLNAASYIGRNVTVQDTSGNVVTGTVTAVDNTGTEPAIVINNTSYTLSMVKRIEPTVTTTTASTSGTGTTATSTTTG